MRRWTARSGMSCLRLDVQTAEEKNPVGTQTHRLSPRWIACANASAVASEPCSTAWSMIPIIMKITLVARAP